MKLRGRIQVKREMRLSLYSGLAMAMIAAENAKAVSSNLEADHRRDEEVSNGDLNMS